MSKKAFVHFVWWRAQEPRNTGAVDPLDKVADYSSTKFDLWFHVDGAYGAPGILDPGKTHLFDGLKRADSVSLDPHKWLYVPVDARMFAVSR